jgi:hypothetical protein
MSAMVDAFPMDGVRLSAFDQIIEACGGRDVLAHLTTTQVCERFVKPATARLEASYCEMLAQRQPGAVGKATVFISHAWKCVFLDVVTRCCFIFGMILKLSSGLICSATTSTGTWSWISIGAAVRSSRLLRLLGGR